MKLTQNIEKHVESLFSTYYIQNTKLDNHGSIFGWNKEQNTLKYFAPDRVCNILFDCIKGRTFTHTHTLLTVYPIFI